MRLGKIGVLNSGPRFPLCVLFTLSIAVPGSAGDRESACQCRILSLDGEDPLGRIWQPAPGFWPGKSHGQSSLVGYSPWGRKESNMTE